ncbi:hypothetical protein ACFL59_05120 [Planctomycetota bacterium]
MPGGDGAPRACLGLVPRAARAAAISLPALLLAAGGSDKEERATVSRERLRREVDSLSRLAFEGDVSPMLYSGIVTSDIPIHMQWTQRKPNENPIAYPPAITDDLYWMAQAAFIRRLLHPSMAGVSEVLCHLLALGEPARVVAESARAEAFLQPLAREIAGIPPLPPAPPSLPRFKGSEEQKMLLRVCVDDLRQADAFTLDPTYAARVRSLGDALLLQLEACADSPHVLLRRNVVARWPGERARPGDPAEIGRGGQGPGRPDAGAAPARAQA